MSSSYEAVNFNYYYLSQVILGCGLVVPISFSVLFPPATPPLVVRAPVLSGIKPNMVISLPMEV